MGAGFDTYVDVARKAPMPGDHDPPEPPEPCPHDAGEVEWKGPPPTDYPNVKGTVIEGECLCGARVIAVERPGGNIENVEAVE